MTTILFIAFLFQKMYFCRKNAPIVKPKDGINCEVDTDGTYFIGKIFLIK